MFTTKKQDTNEVGVSDAINALLDEMSGYQGDSEEYAKLADQLLKLYSLKEVDHKVGSTKRISADTLAIVGGNVLGILMIVGHERTSMVTSKALSLLTKLR